MDILNKIFFGNTLFEWGVGLIILLGSFIVVKILYWIFSKIIKKATSKTKNKLDDVLVEKLERPIVFFVFLIAYWVAIHYLNFQESLLNNLEKVAYFALAINITSVLAKITDALIVHIVMPLTEKTESGFDDQLIPVIRKALKALIWSLGLIIGLDNIGFDITAMIAGLGIGGLALALAAQDSVKNIFAGVMIFLDKPFKLKDRIQISGFDGTVEEVGIRSTRIRTLEGRIVTIPNCTFTDNSVINVSSQPALKVKINLGLTYDTDENDMQKAIDILEDIAKTSKNYDSLKQNFASLEKKSREKIFETALCKITNRLDSKEGIEKNIRNSFYSIFCSYFDPHTSYFSYDTKSSFLSELSTDNFSLGMYVSLNENEELIVQEIVPGGPAARTEIIEKGDQVIKVSPKKGEDFLVSCSSLETIGSIIFSDTHKEITLSMRKKDYSAAFPKIVIQND